jgi:serine/threonine-protein kinase
MLNQLLDGRYQVIQVLGAGGFGQTYIAQDTRIPGSPTCVVKHLKPASSDPKFLETARRLFHSEAETLAKLGNHDQIPRLLAQFEENQEFYLVQEFIQGHPLSAELPLGQRLAENQVIQLLQEVLNILLFVHSQGVIHRDIKPDNIMRRTSDNKLVLIDFGAIKQVRTQLVTDQGQVSATVAIGTPGYMPTEQGQGKPRPNSDIYALGMIGIQALTGLYPNQLQEDISTGEVIWRHQAQISQGLADVLTKMTRYHFKDRYQSATEALQAVQQLTNPYAPPAASPGYTPTDYATEYSRNPGYTPPQPPTPPPQPQPQPSWEQTNPVAPANPYNPPIVTPVGQPTGSGTNHRLPLLVGVGVATVVSAIAGFALIQRQIASNNPNAQTNPSLSQQSCSAVVNGRIRSEPASFRDNVINSASGEQLTVTGKQTPGGWIEVKLANGSLGWAHRDVISNNSEMDSCLKAKGITVQNADDIPRPAAKRATNNTGEPSTSKPPTKDTPPLCKDGKPAEWYPGKGRYVCNNRERSSNSDNQSDSTAPLPKNQTDNTPTPAPEQENPVEALPTPVPEQENPVEALPTPVPRSEVTPY